MQQKTSLSGPRTLLPASCARAIRLVSISCLLGAGAEALAEPPGWGAERGSRASRPASADRFRKFPDAAREGWQDVRRNFQSDLAAAHERARRDLESVRGTMQRETRRLQETIEERRPRGFRFVQVLDAIFGPPGRNPYPREPRGEWNHYDDRPAEPLPPEVAERWQREDAWAENVEARASRRSGRLEEDGRTQGKTRAGLPSPAVPPAAPGEPSATNQPAGAQPNRPSTASSNPPGYTPAADATQPSPSGPSTADATSARSTHEQAGPGAAKDSYPYGLPVPGKAGIVYSPYVEDSGKQVDVRNIPAGTLVKDPYSEKYFRVP